MPGGDYVSPIAGLVLILFSLYMFYLGLGLMQSAQDVASSLLATLIGFVTMSGGVTLIRTWSLSRVYPGKEGEQEKGASRKTK
ncbi:hypothetical protein J4526_05330 [Desulfurococcaceae archaeon MEX13E-LK6-19]|nr:hypothetical protein J4526_05330 [Desulfurococcaceae archaeon MEX13E-LK6-19]